MGSIWLRDLPDVLAGAGLKYRLWSGWENRSRSSGGYDGLYGIVVHHTASNTAPDNDCGYMWNNADDRPIGSVLLERDGRVTVGAAGATNCAGKGGPWTTSNGTVPLDKGNAYTFSIEAANAGTGENWPQAQQDAYLVLCRALCEAYGFVVSSDIRSHFEWAPGRKYDPAGPSAWGGAGQDLWDMNAFRADVASGTSTPPPATKHIQGIDVSKWQGQIDWTQVKNAGYTWSACRTWDRDKKAVDETFVRNRDGQAFATWRLLYYWLEPGRVTEGVDEFFAAVGELRTGEGAMLDAEEEGITVEECIEWCEAVEKRTGLPCAVYTGGYTADGTIWHSDELFDGKRARIFAAYTSEEDAVGHAKGKKWDAWQYSCTGKVPGVDADCDLDRIDNPDAFNRVIKGGAATPPPTTTPPTTGEGKDMAAIMPTIKKGDTGANVERMQHLLAAAGFMDAGNVSNYDGVWGNGTDGAKGKFDDAHGMGGSDTSCGPKSWESLLTGKKW